MYKMANMSYCRFENTYKDLKDCYEALCEAGSIKAVQKDASQYEAPHVKLLVELCKEIAFEFGDETSSD